MRWPSGCQATTEDRRPRVAAELDAHLGRSARPRPSRACRCRPRQSVRPSGLNATLRISSLCSVKVRVSWPSSPRSGVASQMRMVPSGAGRGEAPAVRAERHAPAPAGVSAQAEHLPAGRRVPDAHRLVFAARGEAPAVRAEGDALDVSGMQRRCGGARRSSYPTVSRVRSKLAEASRSPSGLNASALTGWRCAGKVRSSGSPVSGSQSFRPSRKLAGRQRRPSRLNATGIEWLFVSGQGVKELTVLPVPDLHHPVSSRRELSAVGTERNGIRRPKLANGVARFGEHRLAGRRQVPDLHLSGPRRGGQVLAVGVERDADDRIGVRAGKVWTTLARPAVPDLDGPVPARGGESFSVRAERHAVHFRLVPDDQRLDLAEPHQVVPFPLAQVFRTVVE